MLGNPVPGRILANKAPWPGTPTFRVTSTFEQHIASGRGAGIDIGNGRCNDPVLAMAAGVVTFVGQLSTGIGMANVVRYRISGTEELGAAHLATMTVKVGQAVSRGQQIGTLGMTGADACHLHQGYKVNGVEQDWWPLYKDGDDMPNLTSYAPAIITLGGSPLPVAGRAAPSQSATIVYSFPGGRLPTVGTIAADGTTWYPVFDTSPGKKGWYYVAAYNVPAVTYLGEGGDTAEAERKGYNAGRSAVQGAAAAVPPK